jgi:hypothetical protein
MQWDWLHSSLLCSKTENERRHMQWNLLHTSLHCRQNYLRRDVLRLKTELSAFPEASQTAQGPGRNAWYDRFIESVCSAFDRTAVRSASVRLHKELEEMCDEIDWSSLCAVRSIAQCPVRFSKNAQGAGCCMLLAGQLFRLLLVALTLHVVPSVDTLEFLCKSTRCRGPVVSSLQTASSKASS